MHPNSISAWHDCRDIFNKREVMVMTFLDEHSTLSFTDREIMSVLGFVEPNAVRPRITDLIKGNKRHAGGFIEETGSCTCKVTNVTVRLIRIVKVVPDQGQQGTFF